jgi:hypothetical protein
MIYKRIKISTSVLYLLILLVYSCNVLGYKVGKLPTKDNEEWFLLNENHLIGGEHHIRHAEIFGKYLLGYNYYILKGIDIVQATALDGGGYFTGIDSIPTESPIGYELKLFGQSLLSPPRPTSYCSGSTYAVFIEALNLIFASEEKSLDFERYEAMRMQEIDGSRREDGVKFWGYWNADGFGSHYALVQYSKMGDEIKPKEARPGDFMNISWKSGLGHSVIFLGWYVSKDGENYLMYWSSQKGTNGLGDQMVSLDKVKCVKIVRLTKPENLFTFGPSTSVNIEVPCDSIFINNSY